MATPTEDSGPELVFPGYEAGRKIRSVVVLVAMEAEAAPLIERLELTKDDPQPIKPPAPAVSFSGNHFGIAIHVVHNGKCRVHGVDNVGTVPAALATYVALQEFKPDLCISIGTAGGFGKRGGKIGDVYLGTSSENHDRRIPIPVFDKYGIGLYDSIPTPNLIRELKLKEGRVSSGNSLDFTAEDMTRMEAAGADIKEMEAAAIAWTAHLFEVPFFSVKSITDIVDGSRATQEEFLENLHTASKALEDTLIPVLEFVANKTIGEL